MAPSDSQACEQACIGANEVARIMSELRCEWTPLSARSPLAMRQRPMSRRAVMNATKLTPLYKKQLVRLSAVRHWESPPPARC